MSEDMLLGLFIAAAGKDNAFSDDWYSEWLKIEAIALKVNPDWGDGALQNELREAAY